MEAESRLAVAEGRGWRRVKKGDVAGERYKLSPGMMSMFWDQLVPVAAQQREHTAMQSVSFKW